jgi:hypothetical protein
MDIDRARGECRGTPESGLQQPAGERESMGPHVHLEDGRERAPRLEQHEAARLVDRLPSVLLNDRPPGDVEADVNVIGIVA